jgi:hypothetical protein
MIITINEAEVRKNTAQCAIAVTIKPPTVGPTARLKARDIISAADNQQHIRLLSRR